ncbi:hypothetical protein BKA65DRAFT_111164 [Rhexocercosporidium sp. MPI-PUGE-AT-0058]|nr:hypothetical protein BKA65DRAFT_111164 [Rhexocercosporidium sp. MPI-PUGE-AT-0058]
MCGVGMDGPAAIGCLDASNAELIESERRVFISPSLPPAWVWVRYDELLCLLAGLARSTGETCQTSILLRMLSFPTLNQVKLASGHARCCVRACVRILSLPPLHPIPIPIPIPITIRHDMTRPDLVLSYSVLPFSSPPASQPAPVCPHTRTIPSHPISSIHIPIQTSRQKGGRERERVVSLSRVPTRSWPSLHPLPSLQLRSAPLHSLHLLLFQPPTTTTARNHANTTRERDDVNEYRRLFSL